MEDTNMTAPESTEEVVPTEEVTPEAPAEEVAPAEETNTEVLPAEESDEEGEVVPEVDAPVADEATA